MTEVAIVVVGVVVAACALRASVNFALGGLILAMGLLAVSRSVIAPDLLVSNAPVVATLVVLGGMVLDRGRLVIPRGFVAILVLCSSLVVATALTGDGIRFARMIGICSAWVVMVVAAASLGREDRRRLLVFLIALGVAEAVICVAETIGALDALRTRVSADVDGIYSLRDNTVLPMAGNRGQGTLGYPLPLGHILAILAALAVHDRDLRPGLKAVAVPVLLLGMLCTGSRSAMITAAVGVVVGMQLRRSSAARALIVTGIAVALGWMGYAFFRASQSSSDFSLVHRLEVVESVFGMARLPVLQVLLGSGYDAHNSLFAAGVLVTTGTSAPDNAYVMSLITGGLVGLAALVTVIVRALVVATPQLRGAIAASACSFLFYDTLWWHFAAALFWILVGLGLTSRGLRAPAATVDTAETAPAPVLRQTALTMGGRL
ncbi:O-antigen ligase family protein [Cellulomonas sp. P5_C5]